MLIPMLLNIALKSGKLEIEEDAKSYRLVNKSLGATLVMARLDKEAFYQMIRTPEMPATHAEAIAQLQAAEQAQTPPTAPPEPEKVLADAPVPLPAPAHQKPQLQLIQGGAK